MRKVRYGLDLLGWPTGELLQHGRQRIVYGISLVDNLVNYLIGVETAPSYIFSDDVSDDVERISAWWMERWLSRRVLSEDVLTDVARHQTNHAVRHGARVELPMPNWAGDTLF